MFEIEGCLMIFFIVSRWDNRCDKNDALRKPHTLGKGGLHQSSHGDPLKFCISCVTHTCLIGFYRAGKSNIQARDDGYKDGHSDQESDSKVLICDVRLSSSGVRCMRLDWTTGMVLGTALGRMALFMNHPYRSTITSSNPHCKV